MPRRSLVCTAWCLCLDKRMKGGYLLWRWRAELCALWHITPDTQRIEAEGQDVKLSLVVVDKVHTLILWKWRLSILIVTLVLHGQCEAAVMTSKVVSTLGPTLRPEWAPRCTPTSQHVACEHEPCYAVCGRTPWRPLRRSRRRFLTLCDEHECRLDMCLEEEAQVRHVPWIRRQRPQIACKHSASEGSELHPWLRSKWHFRSLKTSAPHCHKHTFWYLQVSMWNIRWLAACSWACVFQSDQHRRMQKKKRAVQWKYSLHQFKIRGHSRSMWSCALTLVEGRRTPWSHAWNDCFHPCAGDTTWQLHFLLKRCDAMVIHSIFVHMTRHDTHFMTMHDTHLWCTNNAEWCRENVKQRAL